MNAKASFQLMLLLACIVTQGCTTQRLWEAKHFAEYGEPSPKANLALAWSDRRRDVFVEYDEIAPRSGKLVRRAYWLKENESHAKPVAKPKFVETHAENLTPLNVHSSAPKEAPPPDERYAVAEHGGRHFRLYGIEGDNSDVHYLPVYCVDSGRWIQVLLTPPAVIADSTVIGGILFLYVAPGLGSFSP